MRSRYQMLAKASDNIFVVFITTTNEKCPLQNGLTLRVIDRITPWDIANLVDFTKNSSISVAYFSYNLFGNLPSQLPCRTVVEIHDVLHLRQEQFQKYGYEAPIKIDRSAELGSLQQYDAVVSLNLEEVEYLKANGLNNSVYLPPFMEFRRVPKSRDGLVTVGFIGSSAKPNIDGLANSIDYIRGLPRVVFAGSISSQAILDGMSPQNIERMGVVPDVSEFYSRIDVALSPIRFGAGLKIKAFEALAYGKRLIATRHSISGFPEGVDDVVSVEDDFSRWNAGLLEETMKIEEKRIEEYFCSHFSWESTDRILRSII